MGRIHNIKQQAIDNENYRHVLESGAHSQIVIMHIPPGEEVGAEVHPDHDQILYLAAGSGRSILDGDEAPFGKGDTVLVPAGTEHNFIASLDQPLKIITIYSPPHHPDGLIQKTKAEADEEGN